MLKEFKWDEKKKGETLVIENNGITVRQTNDWWSNVIGDKGYSTGKHEWILEFQSVANDNPSLEFVWFTSWIQLTRF